MRSTTSFTTAMHRLADALAWRVESNRGTWTITFAPSEFEGLTFSARSLLCIMIRVAMSPARYDGLNWTPENVREKINLHISRDSDGTLVLPRDTTGTDEATLYRLFKGAD